MPVRLVRSAICIGVVGDVVIVIRLHVDHLVAHDADEESVVGAEIVVETPLPRAEIVLLASIDQEIVGD